MIWVAASFYGAFDLVGEKGNMNYVQHCQILEDALTEPAAVYLGENWILVQDNAPAHTSTYTETFLNTYK